ncbi:hypothetical protein SLVCU150_0891 [Staphylococcus lugdunensis VCU150]|nr:hypothetical protein SLGD_00241 [Staphylococcus lugdunensis HKU09-01]KAK58206.1 hypothetical protein SLVCU150_0891 [Staphylococcus lugdunensis VCU150]CCB52654.1 hypothetical protein SLUG_02400 [Staphylococcus lugdunensis N920143]
MSKGLRINDAQGSLSYAGTNHQVQGLKQSFSQQRLLHP